jgi:L-serine dehydratase
MAAALEFRQEIQKLFLDHTLALKPGYRLIVELYGSLSLTGKGHQTDGAICAGLDGLNAKSSKVEEIWASQGRLNEVQKIVLPINGEKLELAFYPDHDLRWQQWQMDGKELPHPNTLRFILQEGEKPAFEKIILSVGGGFTEPIDSATGQRLPAGAQTQLYDLPYPYNSAQEFVEQCQKSALPPWQVVIENEKARGYSEEALRTDLTEILTVFKNCIDQGLKAEGILPGGLNVKRRAKKLFEQMQTGTHRSISPSGLKHSVYAIAVNEENAAGGRVVTAPTNGSSGLIPAVFFTLKESHGLDDLTLQNGLIVASVVGALVKTHASISGAEVGCQGEVGTSCAMAAAGATAMLGGSAKQIEQAAEIGIEHHLGMTCDPIKGLVQVPCIERNAMGAGKALNAVELALASDGDHLISLDRVLTVMKQTGLDLNQKYKETATGGLALG